MWNVWSSTITITNLLIDIAGLNRTYASTRNGVKELRSVWRQELCLLGALKFLHKLKFALSNWDACEVSRGRLFAQGKKSPGKLVHRDGYKTNHSWKSTPLQSRQNLPPLGGFIALFTHSFSPKHINGYWLQIFTYWQVDKCTLALRFNSVGN